MELLITFPKWSRQQINAAATSDYGDVQGLQYFLIATVAQIHSSQKICLGIGELLAALKLSETNIPQQDCRTNPHLEQISSDPSNVCQT